MPKPFRRLTLQGFEDLLRRFPFTRRINAVHMHHTWRPNHVDYRGLDTIERMWRFHTQNNGWSDIAQHITIAPDGSIWTGRNWNQPPASASGNNGNRDVGPFMFEMVGDFDHGRDLFQGKQREVALQVIWLVQKQFGLEPESLRFHKEMSAKSCPGSAIDYQEILAEVRRLHAAPRAADGAPLDERMNDRPFGNEALESNEWLAACSRGLPERDDPADAELSEDAMRPSDVRSLFGGMGLAGSASSASRGDAARGSGLTPEMFMELRPHVINLTQGQFSTGGEFSTDPGDVEAIFGEHLPKALEAAKAEKRPLRLLFYAHGGLVSESSGLRIAYHHVSWWKKNHIYPIYFVWETGFIETVRQLLSRSQQRVPRAGVRDLRDLTDPLVESASRALQGPRIWSGMKRSAELAVAPEGGARFVAHKLKEFCNAHGGEVELHAAGHSAGAIFLAHFLPTALQLKVPPFLTGHLFAPAIRVDAFDRLIEPELGKGIKHLNIYTMRKDLELADTCGPVYGKSLLYLIYNALEPERKAPILGLEISLRNEPALKKLFGLGGEQSGVGEVIWSTSSTSAGRSASRSTTHGGFDDDPATMESAARRILNVDDDKKIVEFPRETVAERGASEWDDPVDWPDELAFLSSGGEPGVSAPARPPVVSVPAPSPAIVVPSGSSSPGVSSSGGRRRALCVGINRYPTAPLAGCVADARTWSDTLVRLGFDPPTMLLDEQATRSAIIQSLTEIVTTSVPGDVVVFQYAGHGTTLPDASGDEGDGDTPNQDEAICPVDFAEGAFLIDDDVAEIIRQIPNGVNLTCFIDCCHSGTITRFAVGLTPQAKRTTDERPRYIAADAALKAAHLEFRRGLGGRRSINSGGLSQMQEILFAACLSSEVAWESNGSGDFTTRATRVLQAGVTGLTHEMLEQRVIGEFGAVPRQHPRLYCPPEARALGLLQPRIFSPVPAAGNGRGVTLGAGANGQDGATAQFLRSIAAALDRGR